MLERLGYTVLTELSASNLAVTKDDRKFIVACMSPAEAPTQSVAIARLHDAVIAAGAESGFCISTRDFTQQAKDYAATAPVRLIDGDQLAASMLRSMGGAVMPETYRAMCCQCGDVVQHKLGSTQPLPCKSGHRVAPTIARAALVPPQQSPTSHAKRHGTRRRPAVSAKAKIRAHNSRLRKNQAAPKPPGKS
jgi:Restriction endonuclease